jgi:hypothetical protein
MLGLKALIWTETPEALYRDIGGAKQLCSEFRFTLSSAPGYKGELGFIRFDSAGRVTVAPGYTWDGASGPTIDTPDTICASLGHDVMYELMGAGLLPVATYKEPADWWFYQRLLHDGTLGFRAWAWYRAVQICGIPKQGDDDVIKRAPIPFPKGEKSAIEVIPGYRIAA